MGFKGAFDRSLDAARYMACCYGVRADLSKCLLFLLAVGEGGGVGCFVDPEES